MCVLGLLVPKEVRITMEDFIKMAAGQLGLGEGETRSATGGVIDLIKGQLDAGTFSQIAEKIPGFDSLGSDSAEADSGGGGMLGGLMGQAASMLGGDLGKAAGVLDIFNKAGMDTEKGGSFLSMFVDFVKDKVGDELWSNIAAYIPGVD